MSDLWFLRRIWLVNNALWAVSVVNDRKLWSTTHTHKRWQWVKRSTSSIVARCTMAGLSRQSVAGSTCRSFPGLYWRRDVLWQLAVLLNNVVILTYLNDWWLLMTSTVTVSLVWVWRQLFVKFGQTFSVIFTHVYVIISNTLIKYNRLIS